MTRKEEIIQIMHENGSHDHNYGHLDIEHVDVDFIAEELIKLFAIPIVSGSLPTVEQVKEKCEKDITGFLDNNTEKELQHYRVAHRRSFEFVQRFIGNDR